MNGTKGFLGFPVNVSKCQNEKAILECKSKKYLENGRKICECIPHHLRAFHETVSYFQIPIDE